MGEVRYFSCWNQIQEAASPEWLVGSISYSDDMRQQTVDLLKADGAHDCNVRHQGPDLVPFMRDYFNLRRSHG